MSFCNFPSYLDISLVILTLRNEIQVSGPHVIQIDVCVSIPILVHGLQHPFT